MADQVEKRRFGAAWVPVIGQGTWHMESDPRREAIAALRGGLDRGLTHIDTAELYGQGVVEELVAEAIEGRRDEVFLVSKVLPSNASYAGTRKACAKSLARLRTDYLDSYLLHWPGPHPLEETMRAFVDLEREGKIRSFGVSNFDVGDLGAAEKLVGRGRLACNQVLYHLLERSIEHEVLPWCEARGVAVVGYSPFGSGRFPSPTSAGGRVLQEIGTANGVSARAVALAFLVRRPSLLTIPKASRASHVEVNAHAAGLHLTADELARIDRAFPLGAPPSWLPTL